MQPVRPGQLQSAERLRDGKIDELLKLVAPLLGLVAQRIIRPKDIGQYGAPERTQLKDMIEAGQFPAPRQLSPRRIGWLEGDIAKWQQNLPVAKSFDLLDVTVIEKSHEPGRKGKMP